MSFTPYWDCCVNFLKHNIHHILLHILKSKVFYLGFDHFKYTMHYEMLCAIWCHWYTWNSVKNNHWGVLLLESCRLKFATLLKASQVILHYAHDILGCYQCKQDKTVKRAKKNFYGLPEMVDLNPETLVCNILIILIKNLLNTLKSSEWQNFISHFLVSL